MCFLNRSHRSSHHQTHTHTATHSYQVPHCSIIHGADAGLAITPPVDSRIKSAWRIPSFSRQQRVVVVFTLLTRIIKSVVTGQAPVTLELRNTPRKNTHNPRWYTHISQLTQFMPPPETYKSEIGSQYLRCARSRPVHTSHYSRLEKPNIPIATQGRLPRIYYT